MGQDVTGGQFGGDVFDFGSPDDLMSRWTNGSLDILIDPVFKIKVHSYDYCD